LGGCMKSENRFSLLPAAFLHHTGSAGAAECYVLVLYSDQGF
jgi:hypothetical protein